MGTSGHTLYIKGEKNKELAKTEVLLGDVISMECTDQTVVSRLKTVKLLRGSLKKRYVISILEVISRIHEIYPNLTVENMGETDLIINHRRSEKERESDSVFEKCVCTSCNLYRCRVFHHVV